MTDRTMAPFQRAHARHDRHAGIRADEAIGTVWTTGQTDLATQLRQGGYDPDTAEIDPGAMPPAIATHAVAAFTQPTDLVLDPDCGAGTTIVEALHAGRHAIGLAGTHRSWQLARANISAAKASGAPMDGMVLILGRRPDTLATAHAAGFTGRVDLILTTVRPRMATPGPTAMSVAIARLRVLLADTRTLLRPGGHVVITAAPYRNPEWPHELLDVPEQITNAAAAAGLLPLARCIALTGTLHHNRIRPPSVRTRRQAATRGHATTSHPIALSAHHLALVFGIGPGSADRSAVIRTPLRLSGGGCCEPPRHDSLGDGRTAVDLGSSTLRSCAA